MGISKVYVCDLCELETTRGELTRLGIRGLDDRPEDADNIDVGPCCHVRPISDVIELAAAARKLAVDG